MTTSLTPNGKRPMGKAKKIALWVGGSVVGLFIIAMVAGAIGVANQPGGWDAAMESAQVSQSAEVDANEEAAKSSSDTAATAPAEKKADEQAAADEAARKADPMTAIMDAADIEGLEAHQEGNNVFVKFPISDNLTSNMIRTGAQMDTLDALKAFSENAPAKYNRVFVQGTFSMQDELGNVEDGQIILNAGYERATVEKINFENMLSEKIWDVMDSGMVHPELQ